MSDIITVNKAIEEIPRFEKNGKLFTSLQTKSGDALAIGADNFMPEHEFIRTRDTLAELRNTNNALFTETSENLLLRSGGQKVPVEDMKALRTKLDNAGFKGLGLDRGTFNVLKDCGGSVGFNAQKSPDYLLKVKPYAANPNITFPMSSAAVNTSFARFDKFKGALEELSPEQQKLFFSELEKNGASPNLPKDIENTLSQHGVRDGALTYPEQKSGMLGFLKKLPLIGGVVTTGVMLSTGANASESIEAGLKAEIPMDEAYSFGEGLGATFKAAVTSGSEQDRHLGNAKESFIDTADMLSFGAVGNFREGLQNNEDNEILMSIYSMGLPDEIVGLQKETILQTEAGRTYIMDNFPGEEQNIEKYAELLKDKQNKSSNSGVGSSLINTAEIKQRAMELEVQESIQRVNQDISIADHDQGLKTDNLTEDISLTSTISMGNREDTPLETGKENNLKKQLNVDTYSL